MRLVGLGLTAYLVALQFLFGLRGAEQVGGQLRTAHVIEDFLAFLQTLASVYVLGAQTAVQAPVTVILKNGIVQRGIDACVLGGCGQVLVVRRQLIADGKALFILGELSELALVFKLLAASLQGEVSLSMGDNGLGRIAVLHDQIAGVT